MTRQPREVRVPAAWRRLVTETLDSVALEVEFTARHELRVRDEFRLRWQVLERVPGWDDVRWVFGSLGGGRALFVVIGEEVAAGVVELVDFRVVRVDDGG